MDPIRVRVPQPPRSAARHLAWSLIRSTLGWLALLALFAATSRIGPLLEFYVEEIDPWIRIVVALIAAGLLVVIVRLIYRMQIQAGPPVSHSDGRPSILYLRSFADDAPPTRWLFGLRPSYEQKLAAVLDRAGNLTAIEAPHRQPNNPNQIWLATDSTRTEQWLDDVTSRMTTASLVVIRTGMTEGLIAEVRAAVANVCPTRLIIALQLGETPARWHPKREQQYQEFLGRIEGIFPKPFPPELRNGTFITFERDWTVRLHPLNDEHESVEVMLQNTLQFLDVAVQGPVTPAAKALRGHTLPFLQQVLIGLVFAALIGVASLMGLVPYHTPLDHAVEAQRARIEKRGCLPKGEVDRFARDLLPSLECE